MDTPKRKKVRLDVLLVKRALAETREKAKAIIMTGNVFVEGEREDKAGSTFPEDVSIEIKGTPMKYVSRGGYKLEKGMELWNISLQDKICMDVGSSTGGFTDCMLQNGAKRVYAIDVGTNQLAWKLRKDERVISLEKTNIRYVTEDVVPEKIAFSSIDVAFISLQKVLLPVKKLLEENGRVVCLVKPQFEAGREKVGKKGVVRDKKVHFEIVSHIMEYAAEIGFKILAVDYSPIKGPEGNIEYLLYLEKRGEEPLEEKNGSVEDAFGETNEEFEREEKVKLEEQYYQWAEKAVKNAHEDLDR